MKVMISGYGKMGHMVEAQLRMRGITCAGASEDITSTPIEVASECVCIDFTTPDAFHKNWKFLADNFKAVVVGTTGWDDIQEEVIAYFKEKRTTLIYASNFSIGVNVFFAAVDYASRMLNAKGYQVYVEEKHHCHKLDRPSGTAKTLAQSIENNMNQKPDISSVRCGEIAGIHEVGFESITDRITLRHEAFSREGFAAGAVEAALMTESIQGVHEFKNLLFQENSI